MYALLVTSAGAITEVEGGAGCIDRGKSCSNDVALGKNDGPQPEKS